MELWRPGNPVRQEFGVATDLGPAAGNNGGDDPGPYLWRLSGLDLRLHAFRVDGGYIEPQAMLAIFGGTKVKDEELESYGPYEVWVAECGYKLPCVALLPEIEAPSCAGCRVATAPGTVAGTRPVRDWSQAEPLRSRPNAGARRKLTRPTEIQL